MWFLCLLGIELRVAYLIFNEKTLGA